VAPMDRENVDTDAIIPKQFLKSIKRTGFGPNLFDEWRYLDKGEPGPGPGRRKPNPDFVLNQPRYAGASILLARKNFGCGSSREHAPWALEQYGFRAIIAPSLRRHLLQQLLQERPAAHRAARARWSQLFDEVARLPRLPAHHRPGAPGHRAAAGCEIPFEVQAFRKYCLLNGFDDIGLTLRHGQDRAFEAQRLATKPWLATPCRANSGQKTIAALKQGASSYQKKSKQHENRHPAG
jgi:3-isopropylmalate/(R)-2-methylmalate dehydratase small subunit